MRSHAQAVIIGGGVIGCSIAYHLTAMGWRDIVVVEQGEPAGGSTWHSAGLVGQLRSSINLTRIMMDSVALYARLEAETGVEPGWMQVGSLRLASEERMAELRRQAVAARGYGLTMELLSPKEAVNLFPVMTSDGLAGAALIPTDGRVDPNGLTQALAAGARTRGAEIVRKTRVLGIPVRGDRVRAVETDHGAIQTEVVVNAAGMWAREVGSMAGVVVPVIPMEHQFIVTKPIPGVRRDFPTLRDPDRLVYFREEVGGLVAGGYEPDPAAWGLDGIPADFEHRLLPPNWDRFEQLGRLAMTRVPALRDAEIVRLINGPEAFTPDGGFILGEAPEVRGYFVAAGFNAHGIAAGGGIGQVLAEWIVEGQPHLDVWRMDIRRFGRQYRSRRYALAKTTEAYARHYEIHYPFQESEAGRNLRLSPVHARVVALCGVLGEKGGWERPNWYATNERGANGGHEPRGWMRKFWSSAIGVEHLATREAAGLFDFSSFSKIEVAGRGALRMLQSITANDLDKPAGTVTYTSMLNERGGIECDLTITRLANERFLIITGAAFGTHDVAWIRRHVPDDGSVQLRDLTGTLTCTGLWGPRAREILRQVTDDDVSNEAFPYLTAREITVGQVPVTALRVTYVGELGW
ncbi:MAG TPA: FAD-dependent oxidoreductase, partial [bacterium]|nr:FAD-dependent oxidoreductase [bacterium]